MKVPRFVCHGSIAAFFASAFVSGGITQAQTVWTGTADAQWSASANWSSGVPVSDLGVQFPSAIPATGSTISLSAAERAGTLEFQNSYTLTGGDLTLTIGTLTVGPTFTTTINSVLAGEEAVTFAKEGTGTLVLGGANTYTGPTIVNAGALNVRHATALGAAAAGTFVSSGAALELQGDITIAGEALALNGAGVANAGALRNISGTNSFTGTITLGTASRIISDAGTLTTGIIALGANPITIGGTGDVTLTGVMTGTGTITKNGAGTLRMANPGSTGLMTINGGVVELMNNATTRYDVVVNSSAILRILGSNIGDGRVVTVNSGGTYDLHQSDQISRLEGSGLVTSGATGSRTLYLTSATKSTFSGVIENGLGTVGIIKSGSGTVTWSGANTYTGTTFIHGGELRLSASGGALTGTSAITIGSGGILRLDNTTVANSGSRLPNAAPITMLGGSFLSDRDQGNYSSSETSGALNIAAGNNTITAETAGIAASGRVTFASLNRSVGSTVHFTNFPTSQDIGVGEAADRNRVVFTTAPALVGGAVAPFDHTNSIIGGWAYHTKDFNNPATFDPVNFATYSALNGGSVVAFTDYVLANPSTWNSTTIARSNLVLSPIGHVTVFAVRLDNGGGFNMLGNTLDIVSGGLIFNPNTTSASTATISNGPLTTDSKDLAIRVDSNLSAATLEISSVILDKFAPVSLIKSGADTLTLSGANLYTGRTTIAEGAVNISADSNLGSAPGSPTAGHLRLYGGTLNATAGNVTINQNRSIELGGATSTLSAANGARLVYNGQIVTIGPGTSGLTLTGDIDMSLTGSSTIGGSLTINGTTAAGGSVISLGGVSNVIGDGLTVGAASNSATLNYTIGDTFSVGKSTPGAFNLDIGSRFSAPASVPNVGIVNLSGTNSFSADVDRIRLGVLTVDPPGNQVTQGTLITADSSVIFARTEVLISDSTTDDLTGSPSKITFGPFTNTLSTSLLTIGGRQGSGIIDIATNGILTLSVGDNGAADVYVGRNNLNTAVTGSGTLSLSNGSVNAIIDSWVIAEKSGGGIGGETGMVTLRTGSVKANNLRIASLSGATGAGFVDGMLGVGSASVEIFGDLAMATVDGANGAARATLTITDDFVPGSLRAGNITHPTADNSSAVIVLDGGGILLGIGIPTKGTISASRLSFLDGQLTNVASITLDGRRVENGSSSGLSFEAALVLRDADLFVPVVLTNPTPGQGGILSQASTSGSGRLIGSSIDLGSANRPIIVEDSTSISNDLRISGSITGSAGLTKTGPGTLRLEGINSYTGGTTVAEGSLIAFLSGALGSGNVSVLDSALTLSIRDANTIADTAVLSLAGGGILNTADAGFVTLDANINEIVGGLFLGGVAQPLGTYGSTFSDATFQNDEFFSGPGIITVVPEPASAVTIIAGLTLLTGLRRLRSNSRS